MQFAHPNEAEVGEVRTTILVAQRQFGEPGNLALGIERKPDQPALDQREDRNGALQMECRLGQNGFTRQQRFCDRLGQF